MSADKYTGRDPARIEEVLYALKELWIQSPDLRLMQLLVNTIRPGVAAPELFYHEDDILLAKIKNHTLKAKK